MAAPAAGEGQCPPGPEAGPQPTPMQPLSLPPLPTKVEPFPSDFFLLAKLQKMFSFLMDSFISSFASTPKSRARPKGRGSQECGVAHG